MEKETIIKSRKKEKTSKEVLTGWEVGFDVKVTWLAVAKMYNPLAAKRGITLTMGFVLLNINEERGTAATKIAPLLGMEPRSLTRLLKKMEEKKLIKRKADPKDKRSVRIHLTNLGLEMKQVAFRNAESFNDMLRERVPEKKLSMFFNVLEEINDLAGEFKVVD